MVSLRFIWRWNHRDGFFLWCHWLHFFRGDSNGFSNDFANVIIIENHIGKSLDNSLENNILWYHWGENIIGKTLDEILWLSIFLHSHFIIFFGGEFQDILRDHMSHDFPILAEKISSVTYCACATSLPFRSFGGSKASDLDSTIETSQASKSDKIWLIMVNNG